MTRSLTPLARHAILPLLVGCFMAAPLTAQAPAATGHEPDEATLYQRLGGLPAIALVVSDFVDVFIQDPVIMANPEVRARKTPQEAPYIKYQVTTLVCQLTDGPCQYQGLGMADAHAGLNVSPAEWDRMVELFATTLERHQVPERETAELFALMSPARDDIVVDR